MEHIVIFSAQLPGAILPSEGFPPALSYAALSVYFATLLWLHRRSERLRGHAMWLPPLLMISMVAMGLAMID